MKDVDQSNDKEKIISIKSTQQDKYMGSKTKDIFIIPSAVEGAAPPRCSDIFVSYLVASIPGGI